MNKTSLDPETIATIEAIPSDTKMLIVLGVVAAIVVLVSLFKFLAGVPFALMSWGTAYVAFTTDTVGVNSNTGIALLFAVVGGGILWLAVFASKRSRAKAAQANAAPAHA